MKLFLPALTAAFLFASVAYAADNKLTVPMNMLNKDGSVQPIGEVVVTETAYGLVLSPSLNANAQEGLHGFHIHQNPDCGATDKGPGMKAGGHWDPMNTGMHSYPWDNAGHQGDLPALYVNKDGKASTPVLAPKLKKLSDIKGHALMVHFGGDNYSDKPAPLGGGGPRYACGAIK